eukprot:NODE_10663_length_1337_cov_4.063636.p1 GENE.NODE_10663_length_1337_cov_4.063636~~NODE_10663_length_1337_cov_4.063636.p1  ORF type:complete len:311 (-),score=122.45 NODE_10663_length_1337_cov_4.063636:285-1217(-)
MGAEPMRIRVREGCRGGREQFKWDSIKEQEFKDRECYLGQSTKIGQMGKFGRYYMHDWFQRKRDTTTSINEERTAIQAYEAELMDEALGRKPKKLLLAKRQVTEEELKEFLKKEKAGELDKDQMGPSKKKVKNEHGTEEDAEEERGNLIGEASTKGLGFAPHRTQNLEEFKARAFGTVSKLQGSASRASGSKDEQDGDAAKQELGEVKHEPTENVEEDRPQAAGETPEVDMPVKKEKKVKEKKKTKKAKKDKDAAKSKRKAEKKAKKAAKAVEKAERELLRARRAERAARSGGHRRNTSASSSSSSSSSS